MNNQSSETPPNHALTVNDKESLIAHYPLFYLLTNRDIRELAKIAKEVTVTPGTVITREGDLVDSVYLILSGKANVTRMATSNEGTGNIDLATLSKGDAIGLAGTGFFAKSGVRTATVTATDNMVLLRFNLHEFQLFLQRPGVAHSALKNTGDEIILMNFIQQSGLFSAMTTDKIQWLAKNIQKNSLRAGTIIFRENDNADEFYFIVSGSVSITTSTEKETTTRLFDAYQIFGEDSYLANTARRAIARAETDCELFVLDRQKILEADTVKKTLLNHVSDFITGIINR